MSDSLQSDYRWASITPDDHSGALYVVMFLNFTYTSTVVMARLLIKSKTLGIDDGTMVIAQAVNIVQFALLMSSLSSGLAKSYNTISNDQYSRMAKTIFAGQIAIYLALGLSKAATVLIVRRLFTADMKKPWRVCNIVTGIVIVWTVSSSILVSAGCSAASISPKTPLQICPGIKIRYLVVTITDAVTDILLTVTPAYLCRRLHMNIRLKLQILGVFALRFPLVVLSSLFFRWWTHSLDNANPGIARTAPLVYQQCQLCVSIIVGTIPSLKAFLQSFDTGSGIKARLTHTSRSEGYRSEGSDARRGHRSSNSMQLDNYCMGQLGQEDIDLEMNETRQGSMNTIVKLGSCNPDEPDKSNFGSTQELVHKQDNSERR